MDNAVKLLYAAFHTSERNAHWQFGTLTTDMAFAVSDTATRDQFFAQATVVKCFTGFFLSADHPVNGMYDIGRTLRNVRDADKRNMLFTRLIEADELEQLHDALVAITKALRREWSASRKPWMVPEWQKLSDDVAQWLDNSTRDEVRMQWMLSFRSRPQKKEDSAEVAESESAVVTVPETPKNDKTSKNEPVISDTLF